MVERRDRQREERLPSGPAQVSEKQRKQQKLGQIVSTLFPTQPPLTWQAAGEGDTVLTTEAEVLAAL